VGTVFRKTFTKPLPAGAETFTRKGERFARWKDAKGKTRTAPLTVGKDGSERLLIESPYFVAKYRDGAGIVETVATGCRDETAARQVLADLERRAELIRSKVMTAAEAAIGKHRGTALAAHFDSYREHQQAGGATGKHVEESRGRLDRLSEECGFSTLSELSREAFERWLAQRGPEGMSARTRNAYRENLVAFCNWCVDSGRLVGNPFAAVAKANVKADPRRQRRAMTEEELRRLLDAARRRPLRDDAAMKKPALLAQRELLGRERALQYKTLVLTGLRKGELASLAVGQLSLDGADSYLTLDAADEKNREGNTVPLRADLVADLRAWLADKLHRSQEDARRHAKPIPFRLPADAPVFKVPKNLLRQLDRDLKAAGIAKRDERGRTLDVHALRTTFGTLMSKGGVAPRTAHAAMRHSDIRLTMGVYTDPKLLDVRGALNVLPELPLEGRREAGRATGTGGPADVSLRALASALAPTLAPTPDFLSTVGAIPDNRGGRQEGRMEDRGAVVSADPVNRKGPLTTGVMSGPSIYPHGDSNPGLLAENQTS
jgi:integrase